MNDDLGMMSAWFAGPKAENAQWFNAWLGRIAEDYSAWRRNYFPEDGVVVDSALRRHNEPFMDAFEDRLLELLARLKNDVPFHSPRYAAHMLAEQTLPGIAGYFAAMLYNPNNVTSDVAPVTVALELEAGRLLCRMIGYDANAWAHLCSGGTSANIEALWAARATKYLPLVVRDVRHTIGLIDPWTRCGNAELLAMSPTAALKWYESLWREIAETSGGDDLVLAARDAFAASQYNIAERGVGAVCAAIGSSPVLLVPESHHYCFEKAMDVLGLGRAALVSVPVDSDFRQRVDALEAAIDGAEREGRHVLAVVAVVGSTEEGSVDPVDQIVAMRARRERAGTSSFWLHADGAYGGYLRTITIPKRCGLGPAHAAVKIGSDVREIALTLPEHGECAALEQTGSCDSVTIDPHKMGYIPYPAGAICFRSNLIKPLMRQTAAYLEEASHDLDAERASDSIGLYVLEGSKPGASAAAVWLSHSLIPLDNTGHGRLMRDNIRNACELHALLEHYPDAAGDEGVRAVCLCPPGSNIVCYAFRPTRADATLHEINALNRAVFEKFNLSADERVCEQNFFVSRTALGARQYSVATVGAFLDRLGVGTEEYASEGVFLLRSVMMNPWYAFAKRRGRYYLSELVGEMYRAAGELARRASSSRVML
ncbi:MAG: pyridoxal-dependent decarboxylase [Planctomycetota bacterium]|nr:pyridoxal-dependent decarboxylase [Planctomycetota bacterium]